MNLFATLAMRVSDRIQYQRERPEFCRLGRMVLTSEGKISAGQVNAFELGRDIERAHPRPPEPDPERHLCIV